MSSYISNISKERDRSSTRRKILLSLWCALFIITLSHGPASGASPLNVNYVSSFPTGGDPIRIAVDKGGMLYAAVPRLGSVLKISNDGSATGSINGFIKPLSIAVDDSGRLYVGDAKDGSVSALNAGQTTGGTSFLGKGKGEFGMPGAISAASNGLVYVTDSLNNVVKAYDQKGAFQFSFGGYGTGSGQMIFPTGIAADNTNQEMYVVDHNNGRVEVFDFQGNFKRSFGAYGGGQGMLTRPHGISVANGKVYVADAYQSNIEVFDTSGNFITFIGQFGSDPGGLRVPMDVKMNGTKLYVSNSDNRRIEVFDVLDPQGLTIAPSVVSFTTPVGVNPPAQNIQLTPQVAGTPVAWTATVSSPFSIGLNQTSGTTPSTVAVGVDVTGLGPGSYSGTATFRSSSGVDYPLAVNLTVLPPPTELFVAPGSLDMLYQVQGALTTKALSITGSGTALSWTAAASAPWLAVSPSSGTTPGMVNVSLTQNVTTMAEGIFTANVTVTSPGAVGSPVTVPVSLKVLVAGSIVVKTNLDTASFSITGPASYSGSGTSWQTDEAKPGIYTIGFDFVNGYRKPATRSFEVKTGQAVTIDIKYEPLDVANIIVAAKGAGLNNDSLVRVLDQNGVLISEFKAFSTMYGARVATADIDGDGTSEILVAPGPAPASQATLKVFRADGTLLSSVGPLARTQYGANIAAGDILGDGSHEVAMSISGLDGSKSVVIYQFSGYTLIEKTRIVVERATTTVSKVSRNPVPANLAFGDIDGDGILELIVSMQGKISVYAFTETLTPTLVYSGAVILPSGKVYGPPMTVSAGDLRGDGIDEILLGYDDGVDSYMGLYDEHLKSQGVPIKVFAVEKSAPTLASMDWTGDGTAEVLAGKGPVLDNNSTLRIYDSKGTLLKEIMPFDSLTKFGVNAAFGKKK